MRARCATLARMTAPGFTNNPRGRPKRGTSFNERIRVACTLQDLDAIAAEVVAAAKDRSNDKQWTAAIGFISAAFTGHAPDVDYSKPLDERLRIMNEHAAAAVAEGDDPKPIIALIQAENITQDTLNKSKQTGEGESGGVTIVLGDGTSLSGVLPTRT